jgi:hypothetical protein
MSSPSQPANPASPPPPKPYIHTRSAHNVKLWIRQAIANGRLRKCAHLGIDEITVREEIEGKVTDAGDSYFVPSCRHHSFESNFAREDDEMQLHILRHSLNSDPVSCPKNCTYYENDRWASVKFNVRKVLNGLYDAARALWKAFAGVTWPQVVVIAMLALIIILLKAPQWVPLLISLGKAIWGKTP